MAVLASYNFTSGFAASANDASVTAGTATNELLFAFTRDSLGYATDPVMNPAPASGATSAAAAITNDSYFYISLTPISGKQMSFTSLTFNATRGGGATPRGYDVRTSVDSYAASIGTANLNTQRTTWTNVSIDLTGSSFQNISSSITFRFYLYAPATTNVIDIDDIVFNGTISDSGTVDQEGFRFRNDDGTETTATWLAAQDTNITQPISTNTRLRALLNSTQNRGSETYRLEYREVGGSTWNVIS